MIYKKKYFFFIILALSNYLINETMKKTISKYNCLILISLFSLSLGFGQNKKPLKTVLFGTEIKTENSNPENGFIRCASTEYEKELQKNNPKRMSDAQFETWITPLIAKYKKDTASRSETGGIITIPVVVHVIHNGQAEGIAPNIKDAQIQSQITVMTQDFRRLAGTPGFNSNPVGADTQIQFVLAKQDPNGNPTNGIDRVNLCQSSWSTTEIEQTVKPTTIWDPTKYLNMWSVDFTNTTLLGYAQFPDASGLAGINTNGGPANTDGVVANYSAFGSSDYDDGTFILSKPYDKGRTMTHEVGHWVGLRHIWGDGTCATDYCADTPTHHTSNYACPVVLNCDRNGNEMVENYMDYTDDLCMNIYTQNQKDRMVVIMNNAARRNSLRTSTKDFAIPLFANDAEVKVENICANIGGSCSTAQASQKITLYNRGTSTLASATINYSVNGGTTFVYNWTGSLAINKGITFDMPVNATTNGTITITVVTANGVTDQRSTNNSSSGNFTLPVKPTNYTFNSVVFRLQRDDYGSETSWNLKNSSGTILFSGGPYTDQPTGGALITQNWNLASNNCYTFTINDSFGDGICCEYGPGFYDIKSLDGNTIIASGGNFSATESKSFSINVLGISEFELSKEIYLYPNPSQGTLNVTIPLKFGLPNSFSISNNLGQILLQKDITSENDFSINTSTLSSGIYFISIKKDSDKKTLRFIKE